MFVLKTKNHFIRPPPAFLNLHKSHLVSVEEFLEKFIFQRNDKWMFVLYTHTHIHRFRYRNNMSKNGCRDRYNGYLEKDRRSANDGDYDLMRHFFSFSFGMAGIFTSIHSPPVVILAGVFARLLKIISSEYGAAYWFILFEILKFLRNEKALCAKVFSFFFRHYFPLC